MVSLMTALWFAHLEAPDRVSVKPHASPGAARDQLPARPPGPRLPAAPARVRRPAVLSEPHEGPRPGRLLDRQRRDRGHRDDLGRAGPSLRRRALRRPARRAPDRAARRRRAGRGRRAGRRSSTRWSRGWARCCGSSTSTASRWTASCPTSPPAGSRRCSRRPAGTPRRSSTAGACARCSSATAARRCAPASTRWATRSTSACCAPTTRELRERLPGGEQAIARLIADLDPRQLLATFRDLGGHDLEALLDAYRATDAVRDRPSVVFAYTIKGWSLPTEGHPSNHSALLTDEQFVDLAAAARRRPATSRGAPSTPSSPEGRLCAAAAARLEREPVDAHEPAAGARASSGASTPGRARPSRRSGASSSTSTTRRPRWPTHVVTVAPDVASSTNLGGWINRSGIWSIGERIDWFADDSDTLVRWRESDHGRHVELGIAEVNLVGLLGELGATWSRDGRPLLPVGTIYDPFVMRAHEPWSFGIYAGGQSILVGHAVGDHARARGRRAPVGRHAVGRHRAARAAWRGSRPSPRTSSGRSCTRSARWGATDGSSAYFRLSTRPIDQGLADVPPEGAEREQRRADVLAGGYRLRDGDARDHRRGGRASSPRRSRPPPSSTPRSSA